MTNRSRSSGRSSSLALLFHLFVTSTLGFVSRGINNVPSSSCRCCESVLLLPPSRRMLTSSSSLAVHHGNGKNKNKNKNDDQEIKHSLSQSSSSSSSSRRDFVKASMAILLASVTVHSISIAAAAAAAATETTTTTTTSATTAADVSTVEIPPSKTLSSSSSSSAWQESISGFVAGGALTATKTLVKYPLDTITVRLQMPSTTTTNPNTSSSSTTTYNTSTTLFTDLYAGIWNPLLANIPGGAVFFAVKDAVKTYLKQELSMSKPWATCISVLIANFPYWLIRNPSEVIKTKQQAAAVVVAVAAAAAADSSMTTATTNSTATTTTATTNTLSAWKQALATERGLGSLYVGYWENIVYAYPADVLKFLLYDFFVSMTVTLTTTTTTTTTGMSTAATAAAAAAAISIPISTPSLENAALAGAVATAVAQFITTPLDVVRNRVMTNTTFLGSNSNNNDNASSTRSSASPSVFEILADISNREGGIPAWFKGSIPRVGKAFLSGAIQFATYEETKLQILHLFGVGN